MSTFTRGKNLNSYCTFRTLIRASIALAIFISTFVNLANAQTRYYWRPTTGNANWNVAANWSLSSGGPANGAVPGISDIAVFDQGSSTCALPGFGTQTIRGLSIVSPFTGIINLNSTNLIVNNTVANSGGPGYVNINTAPGTARFNNTGFGSVSITINADFEVSVSGITVTGSFPFAPSFNITLNEATTVTGVTVGLSTFNGNFTVSSPNNINLSGNTFNLAFTINKILNFNYSLSGLTATVPANVFGPLSSVTIQNSGAGQFNYSNDTYSVPLTISNAAGATGTLKVDNIGTTRNLTFRPNSTGVLNAGHTGDCSVGGTLLVQSNSGSVGVFSFGNGLASSGAMQFTGSTPQVINIVTPEVTSLSFTKLVLNKSASATITANTNIQVTNSATMTNGILVMGNNTATFNDPLSVTGYGTASFVDGLVKFLSAGGTVTFPTGAAPTIYRPLTITFSEALTDISARYFKIASPTYLSVSTPITHVSTFEHWLVNALPSLDFTATLPWRNSDTNNPNYVTDTNELVVSHFSAGQWRDKGGITTDPPTGGAITSGPINTGGLNIGYLTLGSTDANANELSQGKFRWRNTTGNNQWSTPGNWDTGVVPTLADVVVFDGGGPSGNTPCILPAVSVTVAGMISMPAYTSNINLNSSLNVNGTAPISLNGTNFIGSNSLAISGGTNPVDISGVTAATTTAVNVSGNAVTIGSSVFSGSFTATAPATNIDLTGNVTMGRLTFSANLDLNGYSVTINGNGVTNTLTGGTITNSGSANTLSISNTTTGGATISGTNFGAGVNINANTTGTTAITISGAAIFNGTVTMQSPDLFLNGATFNEISSFTKTNNTANVWSGPNTFNKDVTIINQGTGTLTCSAVRDTYNQNLTLQGLSDLTLGGQFDCNLKLAGNLTVRRTTSDIGEFFLGTIEFFGNNAQTINRGSGSMNEIRMTGDVILNKMDAATVTLASTLPIFYVRGSATFTNGIFVVPSPGWIRLYGSVTGGSSVSFVDGMISRMANGAFTFPIGDKNTKTYRPATMSPNAYGYFAYYKKATHPNNNPGVGLESVSRCEYWGTGYGGPLPPPSVYLTLSWVSAECSIPASDYVTDPSKLRIANFDFGGWRNQGNTAWTGTGAAGTVTSNLTDIFAFGALAVTLTSTDEDANPLPVELSEFSGKLTEEKVVSLTWETLSENDNDFFEVQRSGVGLDFIKIGEVPGQGTSFIQHRYSWIDQRPLPGWSYYRLKQVDFDGNANYSKVISIFSELEGNAFSVYPVPAHDKLFLSVKDDVSVFDQMGNVIFIDFEVSEINLERFKPGVYLIKTKSGKVCRFIVN